MNRSGYLLCKKLLCSLLIGSFLIPTVGCTSSPENTAKTDNTTVPSDTSDFKSPESPSLTDQIASQANDLSDAQAISKLRQLVWQEYAEEIATTEPNRKKEVQKNRITKIKIGKTTMKIQTKVVGKAPDDGYPVFLVYHGGGYDPSEGAQMNESQWSGMATRYTQTKVPAIYVSIRSVSDLESSGQIFSTDISWKFYDRIIEDCILYMNANPNKVYIVGYSAGGNGVYQIAPVLADRLASATMTAGHPEGVDLTNLYNLPFYLQVGELDNAYQRNTVTVEYSVKLDELAKKYGGGYLHRCFVHVGKEHGVVGDNASSKQTVVKDLSAWYDSYKSSGTLASAVQNTTSEITDAATLMNAHTRNPIPERIVWAPQTGKSNQRGIDSFYWLSAKQGKDVIDVSLNKSENTITIHSAKVRSGNLIIYLNEDMVDLFSPIKVITPKGTVLEYTPELSLDLLRRTTKERGDPNYQFIASIILSPSDLKS